MPEPSGTVLPVVRQLQAAGVVKVRAKLAWTAALRTNDGGDNNPEGLGGKSRKASSGIIDTVDNINGDKSPARPTGNSAQAGLRRLEKAAATNPEAKALRRPAVASGTIRRCALCWPGGG
jgi:hypothetical protein